MSRFEQRRAKHFCVMIYSSELGHSLARAGLFSLGGFPGAPELRSKILLSHSKLSLRKLLTQKEAVSYAEKREENGLQGRDKPADAEKRDGKESQGAKMNFSEISDMTQKYHSKNMT